MSPPDNGPWQIPVAEFYNHWPIRTEIGACVQYEFSISVVETEDRRSAPVILEAAAAPDDLWGEMDSAVLDFDQRMVQMSWVEPVECDYSHVTLTWGEWSDTGGEMTILYGSAVVAKGQTIYTIEMPSSASRTIVMWDWVDAFDNVHAGGSYLESFE